METKILAATIRIDLYHEQGSDTIKVYKADSDIFFRILKDSHYLVTRVDQAGNKFDKFVFESAKEADHVFNKWTESKGSEDYTWREEWGK